MGAEPVRVWVVDDDASVRFVLAQALREAGYAVSAFDSAAEALVEIEAGSTPDLVFTDVRMPGMDGLGFLDGLKLRHPRLPVVVMSAYTDVGSTAGAFRGGAHDFLSKPFDLDDAVEVASRALAREDAPADAGMAVTAQGADGMVGDSPAMAELFRAVGRLAQVPLNVLVTGETGTGKELVARALHRESPRNAGPFVALNTAAIPAELLESELFGHEAGAFTGAARRQVGRFEQADGGTLFLDEIGDMPAALQTRLLRVLAEGEFFRVGGRSLLRVDVRVVAATHQDLERAVAEGRFRADLLHRLDVVRLRLPPLRERTADIAPLAAHFLLTAARQLGGPAKRLGRDALERLCRHDWPGNVRELENLCWRLAAMAPGETIRPLDLGLDAAARPGAPPGPTEVADDWTGALAQWARERLEAGEEGLHGAATRAMERTLLDAALEHTGGHRQQAARRLGLGRNTLTRKLATRPRRES